MTCMKYRQTDRHTHRRIHIHTTLQIHQDPTHARTDSTSRPHILCPFFAKKNQPKKKSAQIAPTNCLPNCLPFAFAAPKQTPSSLLASARRKREEKKSKKQRGKILRWRGGGGKTKRIEGICVHKYIYTFYIFFKQKYIDLLYFFQKIYRRYTFFLKITRMERRRWRTERITRYIIYIYTYRR